MSRDPPVQRHRLRPATTCHESEPSGGRDARDRRQARPDPVPCSRSLATWQEQQPRDRARRRTDPLPNLARSRRVAHFERAGMRVDSPAHSSVLRKDDQPGDRADAPAAVLGDPAPDPLLAIDARKQGLDVGHHGLDLDNQQRLVLRVPGQHVDGPSFAEVVEGRLWDNLPPVGREDRHDLVDESGMRGIEETIECLALPVESGRRSGTQRLGDLEDGPHREAPRLATLGTRNRGLRDACPTGNLGLRPATMATQRAKPEPEPNGVHATQDDALYSP